MSVVNVLHATPAQVAAVMAGESTLLPLDGMTCPRCRPHGTYSVLRISACWACNGLGLVPPDVSGRCGVAADGLLVGTVEVVEVLPVVGPKCINDYAHLPEGERVRVLSSHGSALALIEFTNHSGWSLNDYRHLLPLLDDPESLVGRWVALVSDPVPTSERCPAGCDRGSISGDSADTEALCPTCDGDGSCPPVPVSAAPAGTVTTWGGLTLC